MEPRSKDKYSAEKGRPVSTWRHGQVSNAGLHRVLMNASVNGTSCLGIYYQTITQRVLPWQSLYPLSLLESRTTQESFLSCSGHPTPALSVISLEFIRSERVQFPLHACLLYGMYRGCFLKGSRAWHSGATYVLLAEWRQTEAKLKFSQGRREGRH